jgi:pimeloyl-ACP methyl ester carboxylesterase
MPTFERGDVRLYYEEHGSGFPLMLFAPGGMRSQLGLWSGRPGSPDEKPPWIDPTTDLSDSFRVVAIDQRNAGRSSAPVSGADGWHTYASDAVALMDHLGIDKTHAMGGCIGSSFVLGLIDAALDRVSAGVLQNPIGLTSSNRPAFDGMFDDWANEIGPDHPEAGPDAWSSFREAMFGGDFVFSVSRDFVRHIDVPLLILPGDDTFHPREIAEEIAGLAPQAQILSPWAGENHKPQTRETIRTFLRSHTP